MANYFEQFLEPTAPPSGGAPPKQPNYFEQFLDAPKLETPAVPVARPAETKPAPSSFVDAMVSVPRGLLQGLIDAASASGQAAQVEMGQPVDVPDSDKAMEVVEKEVTGPMHQPETTAGKLTASAARFASNPASYVGPGTALAKGTAALAAGAGSEGAGLIAGEGSKYEQPARIAGAVIGGSAAIRGAARARGTGSAPTVDELKAAARAGYEAPEVAAVEIKASAGPKLAEEIQTNLNSAGIDDNLAPKTFAIIQKLGNVPDDSFLTVGNIRSLRRTLRNAANSIDPTERLAAKSSIQHLDEWLSNIPDKDIIAGSPATASGILRDANGNYAAAMRAAEMDARTLRAELRTAAANSGMNLANTVRQRMADVLINPRLRRGFSDGELAQMDAIVRGSGPENALRAAGNVLGGGGGLGAGIWALGGLATHGAVALAPVAGYLLKQASSRLVMRKADRLNESIRMRSPLGEEGLVEAGSQPSALTSSLPAEMSQPGTGERNRPVRLELPEDVNFADGGTAEPSPAQAAAGNYRKRHLKWKGLDIAIETERGGERTGMGPDGMPWSTVMAHPYGYLKKTTGRDDDPIDVYVGPRPHSQHVFVVDQADPASGRFDEHKVIIGARDAAEASGIYDTGFSDGSGPDRRTAITRMSIPGLKMWLENGDTTKPAAPSSGGRARWASAKPSMSLDELMSDPRSAKEIREGMRPEFEATGYAEGGSVDDTLLPPAYLNDSTTRTARAIGDAAVDVAAQPFRDIKRGLSGEMTPGEAKNFAFEAAMGLIPMRAGQALSAGAKGIRAFHGSPHDFDKFDISKIGTGEGAQAYGQGLYFAENPSVAESYKTAGGSHRPAGLALNYIKGYGSRERAIAALENKAEVLYPVDSSDRAYVEALRLLKENNLPQARMYEVNINAHPEQFLDWDRPLSAQPEMFERLRQTRIIDDKSPPYQKTGQAEGRALVQTPGASRMEDRLRDAGVPGVKYLDQGSRTAGDGSRNYVLFRDDIVDILKKYGVSSVAALPPAVQAAIGERAATAEAAPNYARGGVVPLRKGTRLRAPKTALHTPALPKAPKPRKLTLPKLGKI